ncbi:3-deoxy-manno-octulosonate cytidylyltransferase (CMP-KDO synthetase) [Pedobacter cryoconitis]|uniref:3-deoxy-manno-octulosonate cytidylyltransferase n=1 Tax=Pedobacter cryoconitis TaxID=188932 RepID=UPI0016213C4C|nr:3-deoxy-manno-octulosonate cytidylyltransferase [Pedobacter cryoconitis]MBB6271618.1 3-deoxy-manno-octulosonate cytidylyltransferase (CMP-KDO synthetase) [Pedobacter cryoconitis]
MDFIVVIPARYQSSRFPGKPLTVIDGKSMLQRTYEQCVQAVDKSLIYVATEDQRIVDHCRLLDIQVLLTSDHCLTGTDRIAEVADLVKADYYINVQGDEPLFNPDDIKKIISRLDTYPGEILNGYCSITDERQYRSKSVPKVVFRPDGRLLYMSRSPVPGNKGLDFVKGWRQVCIYAFPFAALKAFASEKDKTTLEAEEDIEILRFLELNYEVRMVELSSESIAVDNPEDLTDVLARLKEDAIKI